jgi:predicted amidohydrolase YtcJ
MAAPDLILYNGRIYPTVDPHARFEALAIWKGVVTELGSDRDILNLKGPQTEKKNLHGRVVLPGFCDCHIHLLNYGMLLRTLDLSKLGSIAEMKKRVAIASSKEREDSWILGRGWDDAKLRDGRYPTRYDLDEATSHAVLLKRVCGHVAVASSKALTSAGIAQDTPDPEGGIIVRDSKGIPNGVLKERAIELVEKVVPQSADETRKALTTASRQLLKLGITSLHCIVSDSNELVELRRLKDEGKILQSIYSIVPLSLFDHLTDLGFSTERGREGFRIGGVKLFLDGSLGARTAALSAPYSDEPGSSGMLTMNREHLERVVVKAREAGFQLCIHSIGDRAVELATQVLDASFEAQNCRERRHRIEHASLVTVESIQKMRRLGVIASIQPRFIYSDSWARQRLGLERLPNLYPFGTLTKQRVVLAAGSDCPVEDPNPFEGIWSAITRPGLDSSEALTVMQALVAYSRNAAYASFCEDARGTLEPGKIADMVVVDRDPFESSPDSIRETNVVETIISGTVVS